VGGDEGWIEEVISMSVETGCAIECVRRHFRSEGYRRCLKFLIVTLISISYLSYGLTVANWIMLFA
jgi:hypothetical protein